MENRIKAVMFDLDGTLLPMDQDEFTKGYFKFLVKKLLPYGYEPESLISAIWHGTGAMVKNNGEITNEEAFWKDFSNTYGEQRAEKDRSLFEEFYDIDFKSARHTCGYTPKSAEAIEILKQKNIRRILATNPIFPKTATDTRIEWAGVNKDDFEFYTTYENIGFSKPNPEYYKEILRRAALAPEDCLMVGNDVDEDMVAESLGINVFLLTDCMINKSGKDIERYRHGSFDRLLTYLKEL